MAGVWAWITGLPDPSDWPETPDPRFTLQLAGSWAKSILLKAERSAALAAFSVSLHGFSPSKTIWTSNPFQGLYPLFLQLVREVISRAPPFSSSPVAGVPKLNLRQFFDNAGPSPQFESFFDLLFLLRLFWLCACDSPADVGQLFFQAVPDNLARSLRCGAAMKDFLLAAGADWELLFVGF